MSNCTREALNLVFHIESDWEDETQLGKTMLRKATRTRGVDDVQVLRLIIKTMRQFGMEMMFTQYRPETIQISADKYLEQIERQGKSFLPVESGGLEFSFAKDPASRQAFLTIKDKKANSAILWDDWLAPFLDIGGFVQAWLTDVEYDYWQNAKDQLQYKSANRSYAHLPMKTNGLPPPLNRLEIDISDNPGRSIIRTGYREAVGSKMWLSSLFWHLVGTVPKEKLLSAEGFVVQQVSSEIIKVITAESCFCDKSTERIQRKLRSILYNEPEMLQR